ARAPTPKAENTSASAIRTDPATVSPAAVAGKTGSYKCSPGRNHGPDARGRRGGPVVSGQRPWMCAPAAPAQPDRRHSSQSQPDPAQLQWPRAPASRQITRAPAETMGPTSPGRNHGPDARGRRGGPVVSGQRPWMAAPASAHMDVRPSGPGPAGPPRLEPKPARPGAVAVAVAVAGAVAAPANQACPQRWNSAMLSTCAVCGNMSIAPALTSRYPCSCTRKPASRASEPGWQLT